MKPRDHGHQFIEQTRVRNMASTLILLENLLEPELRVCICINVPLIKKCTEITKG